jgi:hypothetical protein
VKKFCGVEPGTLHALGCVTVAAARIEMVARDILANLHVDPGKRQAGKVLQDIRRAVRRGEVPAHSRHDPETLIQWTQDAEAALSARHQLAHSVALRLGADPVHMHLRTGAITPQTTDAIMETAKDVADVAARGLDHYSSLIHNPRPGVFLPNVAYLGRWVPWITSELDGDVGPPGPEELQELRSRLGPFPAIGS